MSGSKTTYIYMSDLIEQIRSQKVAEPQMDDAGSIVNIDATQDVTKLHQQEASADAASVIAGPTFSEYVSSQNIESNRHADIDRNIPIKEIAWSCDDVVNAEICKLQLPRDAFTGDNTGTPNTMNFRNYAFARMDQVVTVEIATSPFSVGTLQISWYYLHQNDNSYAHRDHVFSRSHMIHALIEAGSSNPGVLNIPYAYSQPVLKVASGDVTDKNYLVLGELKIKVLNRLKVKDGEKSVMTGWVNWRASNTQFTGHVHADYGMPQMETATAIGSMMLAESALRLINPDGNRDMPPSIAPPTPVQIVNAGNMAYGTGISEPINAFRLDPMGQTPFSNMANAGLQISDFLKTFGLIKTIEWSCNDSAGNMLDILPAGPYMSIQDYMKVDIKSKSYSIIPPIAFLSSMYAFWRGEVEYRIDIISNQFYRGAIMMVFCPGITKPIQFKHAKAFTYVTFAVDTTRSFTYTVPYITDRVWWPRYHSGAGTINDYPAPGTVQIFVLNRLSANDQVASTIDLNIYIRAGLTYEVSVPVQPCISTSLFSYYPVPIFSNYVRALDGYCPYYTGTSRYCYSNRKCVLRYGAYVDHLAIFTTPNLGGYYKYSGVPVMFRKYDDATKKWVTSDIPVLFAVGHSDESGNWWLMPIDTEVNAQKYCETKDDKYLLDYVNDDVDAGISMFAYKNEQWNFNKWPPAKETKREDSFEMLVKPQGQRGEGAPIELPSGSLRSTSGGVVTFGEHHMNLKTLLRRYQYVGKYKLRSEKTQTVASYVDILLNPALMMTIDENSQDWLKYGREGLATLFGTCYRFFRGSMRLKLVVGSSYVGRSAVLIVQHKPDVWRSSATAGVYTMPQQGYATHTHNIGLNPVVAFEIPFYKDCIHGYLCASPTDPGSELGRASNLGRLVLYATDSGTPVTLDIRVFYALGDDMDFEIFQGCPPVKFLDGVVVAKQSEDAHDRYCYELGETKMRAQRELAECEQLLREQVLTNSQGTSTAPFIAEPQSDEEGVKVIHVPETVDPQAPGLLDRARGALDFASTSTQKMTDLIDKINPAIDNMNNMFNNVNVSVNKFAEVGDTLQQLLYKIQKKVTACDLSSIIHNIIHIIVSPTAATFITSMVLIVVAATGLATDKIPEMLEKGKSFFGKFFSRIESQETMAQPQSDLDTEECLGIVGGIAALVAIAVGYTGKFGGSFWANFKTIQMDSFRFSRGLDGAINTLKKFIVVIKAALKYIVRKIGFTYDSIVFKTMSTEVQDWAKEVELLIDPDVLSASDASTSYCDSVYILHLRGSKFLQDMTQVKGVSPAVNMLRIYMQRLEAVKSRLQAQGKYPYVRPCPFSICINGKRGCGKSKMLLTLCADLSSVMGEPFAPHQVYTVNHVNAHWDTCKNEKFVIIDDVWQLKTPDADQTYANTYFGLVGCVPFVPPMANLNDKYTRLAPEVVIATSNTPYPERHALGDKEALFRRRHLNVWVVVDPTLVDSCMEGGTLQFSKLPEERKENFGWLRFHVISPIKEQDCGQLKYEDGLTYEEFKKIMCQKFVDHRNNEIESLRKFDERVHNDVLAQQLEKEEPLSFKTINNVRSSLLVKKFEKDIKEIKDYMRDTLPALLKIRMSEDEWTQDDADRYTKGLEKLIYKFDPNKPLLCAEPQGVGDSKVFIADEIGVKEESVLKDPTALNSRATVEEIQKIIKEDAENLLICPASMEQSTSTMSAVKQRLMRMYAYSAEDRIQALPTSDFSTDDLIKSTIQSADALVELCNKNKAVGELITEYVLSVYKEVTAQTSPTVFGIKEDKIKKLDEFLKSQHLPRSSLEVSDGEVKRTPKACKTFWIFAKIRCFLTKRLGNKTEELVLSYLLRDFPFENINKCNCSYYVVNRHCEKIIRAGDKYIYMKTCDNRHVDIDQVDFRIMKPCMPQCRVWNTFINTDKEHYLDDSDIKQAVAFIRIMQRCQLIMYQYGVVYSANKVYEQFDNGKWHKISSVLKFAAGVVGVMAVTTFAFSMYNKTKSAYLPQATHVYNSTEKTGGHSGPSQAIRVARLQPQNDNLGVVVQDDYNNYIKETVPVIQRNMATLIVLVPGTDGIENEYTQFYAHILFLKEKTALMVKHCWDMLVDRASRPGAKCKLLRLPQFEAHIDLSKCKIDDYTKGTSNLMLVTFPATVPTFKNIINQIPTKAQHKKLCKKGKLLVGDKIMDINLRFSSNKLPIGPTFNSDPVELPNYYYYDREQKGWCGGVVLSNEHHPCVVGIHVAGGNAAGPFGAAEPIAKEMFIEVKPLQSKIVDMVEPVSLLPIETGTHAIDGNFMMVGRVEPQYAHNETGQTQIVPSLVHGIFPVTTEPAPLQKNDARLPPGTSPMLAGVAKLGQPIDGFPQDLLDFASNSLEAELKANVEPIIRLEPLSIQEATMGIPGVIAGINMQTSEGFPLSAFRPAGVRNKKWLFDIDYTDDGNILNGVDERLWAIMKHKEAQRKNGIVPFTVFVDCLKDARIPKEKCSIPGKTRIFSTSPVDFLIQFRQYFLPYLSAHSASRDRFCSKVGINVNGYEWTMLVKRMHAHSDHHACGDYSNFGAGFSVEVAEIAHSAIIKWFDFYGQSEEERLIRTVLLRELLYSYHLCFDVIYRTHSGMPSGSPITVETNDLVNFCYVTMAWHAIMRPLGLGSYYYFKKYVQIATYGDDLWLAISPVVIDHFNNVAIQNFFAEYGVKYTDADKGGEMIPFKPLEEVSFLKRHIIPHPTRDAYLARLELGPTLDIANWCWKSIDLAKSTVVNMEACSDMLYGYGPETHREYKRKLQDAANALGYVGNFRSWEELDYIFLGPEGNLIKSLKKTKTKMISEKIVEII